MRLTKSFLSPWQESSSRDGIAERIKRCQVVFSFPGDFHFPNQNWDSIAIFAHYDIGIYSMFLEFSGLSDVVSNCVLLGRIYVELFHCLNYFELEMSLKWVATRDLHD